MTEIQQPGTSLYVGELDPSVNEAMLFELFNPMGPISSIRVCRDAVTRRSLGYGYVNFHNQTDGEKALEELNYYFLKTKPIRIMWSQRDPSLRRNGSGNIFIKNLDNSIDNKALHDTFSMFGHILSCKIAVDEAGNSKGYGFVHFADSDAANAAIEAVNGMLINEKQVFVGTHVSKKERMSKLEETRQLYTNVYVKNLPDTFSNEELMKLFTPFGEIDSAMLVCDEDGNPKGFAFVNFKESDSAHAAVEALNEKDHNGTTLFVGRAQKKTEREEELRKQYEKIREEKLSQYQGVNLYVKNLDDTVTEDQLRQEFSIFGTISSCRIMKDEKTEISKGFGFVCFTSPDEATKAVTEMNGKMIGAKPIYVALAQRKDIRRQFLSGQIQQRNQMVRNPQNPMGMPGYAGAPPMYYPNPVPQAAGRGGMYFQPPAMGRPRYPQNGQVAVAPYQNQPGMPQQFGAVPVGATASQGIRAPRPNRPQQSQQQFQNAIPIPGPQSAGRGRGQFKYAPNTRNPALPQQPQQPSAPRSTLNAATLASLPEVEQRKILGAHIFPLVVPYSEPLAGKVTGILLDTDLSELLLILETPEALDAKVTEIVEALEEHIREESAATATN